MIYKRIGHWHLDVRIHGVRYREALNTTDKRQAKELEKNRIAEIKGIGRAGFGHFGDGWWRRSWNRRPRIGAAARFQAAMAPRSPFPDSTASCAASLPTHLAVSRTSFRQAVRQPFCGREGSIKWWARQDSNL